MASGRESPLITNLSNISGSPKWSMRGKAATNPRVGTPGPGCYTSAGPDSDKYNKPASFGFGSAPRDLNRANSAPGPGQYTPSDPRQTSSQYGFGSSTRKGVPNRADQPGPGAYSAPPRIGAEGPKFTASGKRSGNVNSLTPGPGAYQQPMEGQGNKETASPKYGFGSSPRDNGSHSPNPGPGAYNNDSQLAGPNFSMRPQLTTGKRVETPGPGAYSAPPRIGAEGPKFTASGKRSGNINSLTPGPGAYQQPTEGQGHKETASPKYGFGSSPRDNGNGSPNPGPGSYNNDSQLAGPKFSMRPQLATGKRVETPGPGAHGGSWTQFG